ncbi:hypothetical protein DL1_08575 [Thioclava dalianensis]|uniref:Uncharacterized protein n=1 Tax=Thioclava dalianensis TaxID=1185766 RepID=A0A074U2F5_9RHOB|nr:hypothetical protein [Thioclava dalianensis]KEP68822.1 hypothetical protein DL1_08575 [Thioclava dalianensis]SFN49699.1 hypothetical protein SAMN05216224_10672 [Thioclava dalianensis]
MANDLPSRILVWRGYPKLDHIGTWATTRYPDEAVPYVPADRALPWRDQLELKLLGKMMTDPADFGRFDTYWNIKAFVSDEITYDIARAILRDMTNRKLCDFRSGLFDEEGIVAGSGYGVTEAGAKHYESLMYYRPPEPIVKVKPLEWTDVEDPDSLFGIVARAPCVFPGDFEEYVIFDDALAENSVIEDDNTFWFDGRSKHPSLESAKAAAQADYEKTILSALHIGGDA